VIFQANACSRPPDPSKSILIVDGKFAAKVNSLRVIGD
jgi:hypothetical protein